MPTTLDMLKASSLWDARYGLPLGPSNNNPWIYMAYAEVILRFEKEALPQERVWDHYVSCESALPYERRACGLFARWPDGGGGRTSHDEIMGAAFLDRVIAFEVLEYLKKSKGFFNTTGEPKKSLLDTNVFRLPWMLPYLTSRAEMDCGIFLQLVWAGHIIYSSFTNRGEDDAGGRLKNWLMMHEMQRYPICKRAITFWLNRMKAAGQTLAGSLAREPKEDPILSVLAPIDWRLLDAPRT